MMAMPFPGMAEEEDEGDACAASENLFSPAFFSSFFTFGGRTGAGGDTLVGLGNPCSLLSTCALGGPGGSSITVTMDVLSARSLHMFQRSRALSTKRLDGFTQACPA